MRKLALPMVHPDPWVPPGAVLGGLGPPTIQSGGWVTNNFATYVPFWSDIPCTIYSLSIPCYVAGGNYDIGLYLADMTKVQSVGSTAFSTTGVKTMTLTSDFRLTPGMVYYYAVWMSSGTGRIGMSVPGSVLEAISYGIGQQASLTTGLPSPGAPVAATLVGTPFVAFGVR